MAGPDLSVPQVGLDQQLIAAALDDLQLFSTLMPGRSISRCEKSALTEGVILLSFLLPKKSREIRREGRIPILAQKLERLTAHTGLRRGVALLVLPFFGIVAAFGIAPDTVTDRAPRTRSSNNSPFRNYPRFSRTPVVARGLVRAMTRSLLLPERC